jgi:hypothetical protein
VALTQWSIDLSEAQFWSRTERTSSRKGDDNFIFQFHYTSEQKKCNTNVNNVKTFFPILYLRRCTGLVFDDGACYSVVVLEVLLTLLKAPVGPELGAGRAKLLDALRHLHFQI